MYAQLSERYRKIGRLLYERQGGAFVHVAIVPPHIKGLAKAVRWYENGEV